MEAAKIQSTKSSNRIEGIFTSDRRLEELVSKRTEPRNRNEQEISGYRDVLATIHESYDFISPTVNVILQLHRDLYSYGHDGFGGKFKSGDNIIAEEDDDGNQTVRFMPVSAFDTSEAMRLIKDTVGKISKKEILEKCPDISTKTVERALADLVKQGSIRKVGASSATSYVWSDVPADGSGKSIEF